MMKMEKLSVFLVLLQCRFDKKLEDLEEICELAVRALEEIIDYSCYPN